MIASYQDYRYMRQQGIPHENNLNHQSYNRSLFFGEPNYGYNTNTYRIGLNYTHYFNHDWILNQNFALTKTDLIANPVLAFGRSHLPIIKRAINYQDKQDINYTLDTNIQRKFKLNNVNYDLMIGMDLMRERSNYYRRIDVINPFHANHLDYGITRVREGRPNREKIYNQYAGLYLRNTINIGDNWLIGLSGRHDWTQVEVNHAIQNTRLKNSDHAFTGSASVMYRLHDMFAPYISYSTSFKPVTDTGEQGQILNPERGEQIEVGMKFQALDQQLQGYLAYYDLVRKNVTESDISRGYSIQTGKQVTQGLEAEVAASLSDQWNILATYSFIPTAKIIQSRREDEIGQRINHVPRHAGMLSTQYYFSADQLQLGWNIGAGIRYQGARVAKRSRDSIYLPHYVLFDVHVGYDTEDWGMGLGIKNLFDKNYLVGTTPNAQLVNWGDPRMIRFNVKLNF